MEDSTNVRKKAHNLNEVSLSSPDVEFIKSDTFLHDLSTYKLGKKNISWTGFSRERLIEKLSSLGYSKRFADSNSAVSEMYYIHEFDGKIEQVNSIRIADHLAKEIEAMGDIHFECNELTHETLNILLREKFKCQRNYFESENFLNNLPLHSKDILRDTEHEIRIPFKNCIVTISKAGGVKAVQYSDLPLLCVWKNHIVDHVITVLEDSESIATSQFSKFIERVSTNSGKDCPEKRDAFDSAIGYLIHSYCIPSVNKAVIQYDEQITDLKTPQGGTGKGLLANALKQVRPQTVRIDGQRYSSKDKFAYQNIDHSTQIAWFDDCRKDFDIDRLNSALTDGWEVEAKFVKSLYIPPVESPKVIISSNTVLSGEGNTRQRRQFVIEFSDYFSRRQKEVPEPIVSEFGCKFFSDDWDQDEWTLFFNYLFYACLFYLTEGLKPYKSDAHIRNRIKQQCGDEFYEFTHPDGKFKYTPGQWYNLKYETDEINSSYFDGEPVSAKSISEKMKKMASYYGMQYQSKRINGEGGKVNQFALISGHVDTWTR